VDHFNLARLKGGEEVRLQLGAGETLHLHQELTRLHALAAEGIPPGQETFIVAREDEAVQVTGRARQIIQELLEGGDEDIWSALSELQPNLFRALLVHKLNDLREQSVAQFEYELQRGEWSEDGWQEFFEQNTWIFGYGLSYRFLSSFEPQPHYGGTTVTGSGAQRGDFLAITEAERRFTVLVEIKKPNSLLVSAEPYRNQAHVIGRELAGGVAQLQANCRTWELSGAREEANAERLAEAEAYTIQPKGILVVGNLGQLDSIGKRTTFELFRRNLTNPEVITFDELLERSKHLLLNARIQASDLPAPAADEEDDFPF
jgi:hypothetical protein